MTTTLSTPPTRTVDCERFAVALTNVPKNRPRVSVYAWDETDAAKFWLHDYDPNDINAVPAQVITAIVARLFFSYYRRVAPMSAVFGQWLKVLQDGTGSVSWNRGTASNSVLIRWNDLALAVHRARYPKTKDGTGLGEPQYRNTGLWAVCYDTTGYCGRKTCTHRGTMLNGCLVSRYYNELCNCGYLVPWSNTNGIGFATLFTPLRNCLEAAYISVRNDRSHKKVNKVPYWVANWFEDVQRIVPSLMATVDFRRIVSDNLRKHVDAVFSERFRFSAMHSLSPDFAEIMARWDRHCSLAAWDFGHRETMYADDRYDLNGALRVDEPTLDALKATCPLPEVMFSPIAATSQSS